jgi:hypothetical protein
VRKINTVVGPSQRGTLAVTPLLQHAPGRLIRPVWEDTTQAHLVLNRGTPSFTQASLDLLNGPSSGDRRNSQTLTMAIATKDQDAPVTVHKISINAEEVREAVDLEHALFIRKLSDGRVILVWVWSCWVGTTQSRELLDLSLKGTNSVRPSASW